MGATTHLFVRLELSTKYVGKWTLPVAVYFALPPIFQDNPETRSTPRNNLIQP